MGRRREAVVCHTRPAALHYRAWMERPRHKLTRRMMRVMAVGVEAAHMRMAHHIELALEMREQEWEIDRAGVENSGPV